MLKRWNQIKSFIQSNLLVISLITIISLLVIAFLNKDLPNTLTFIQTILAIVVLVPVILSLRELIASLKKYNAKPDMRVTFIPGYITRTNAELIANNELSNTGEFRVEVNYSNLLDDWRDSSNQQPQMMFIVKNLGEAVLSAPVIRIIPQDVERLDLTLTPHRRTGFRQESEGYVLYNPVGHIMTKDTVMYGFNYDVPKSNIHTAKGVISKYKISIRGANDDQVWTFMLNLTVLEG